MECRGLPPALLYHKAWPSLESRLRFQFHELPAESVWSVTSNACVSILALSLSGSQYVWIPSAAGTEASAAPRYLVARRRLRLPVAMAQAARSFRRSSVTLQVTPARSAGPGNKEDPSPARSR